LVGYLHLKNNVVLKRIPNQITFIPKGYKSSDFEYDEFGNGFIPVRDITIDHNYIKNCEIVEKQINSETFQRNRLIDYLPKAFHNLLWWLAIIVNISLANFLFFGCMPAVKNEPSNSGKIFMFFFFLLISFSIMSPLLWILKI